MKMYVCTLKNIYSSRCSHIAVQVGTEYGTELHWNMQEFIYNRNNRRERMRLLSDVQLTL